MSISYNESQLASIATSESLSLKIEEDPTKFRVLTGDRPTGPLHIGHYFGTLQNRVLLQDKGLDMFLVIADYQVITDRTTSSSLASTVYEVLADYLACGIDPSKTTIFTHSQIPELNQLLLPFLSLVSQAELERNPTVKEESSVSGALNALMLTYPVHQAADILFCKANVVPAGLDQLPHLQLTKTIAKRFNKAYGFTFPKPEALLSSTPVLLGTDGTKMSKSRNNAIAISATTNQTAQLIKKATTDAIKDIYYDPTNRPTVSNLILLASLCSNQSIEAVLADLENQGSQGLKNYLTDSINSYFAPIRAKRQAIVTDQAYLRQVLTQGNEKARSLAVDTLEQVHKNMSMQY